MVTQSFGPPAPMPLGLRKSVPMNSADLPGSATLYQDTFTGVENRTHYIVMSGPSMDALMDGISSTLNSDNGQKFQKRASSVRKLLSTNLMLHVKTWN